MMSFMDPAWLHDIVQGLVRHGPWAAFCFYLAWNLFRLQSRTVEALTAVRTLIENLECMKEND